MTELFGINGLARLFEGEGTIFTMKRWPYTRVSSLYMRVQMLDQDVIEALHEEFGGSKGTYQRNGKPFSQWTLTGAAAAILAHRMLPYLFTRRQAQVMSAIDEWSKNRDENDRELQKFIRGCT